MKGAPAVLLAVAALTLAACGSSRPRLKPAAFTSEATQVCRTVRARSAALVQPVVPGDVPVFLRRAARVLRAGVASLEKLRPPAPLQARWSRQTGLLNRQLAIVVHLSHSVHDGKGDAVAAVRAYSRQLSSLRAQTAAGWRALGLTGCEAPA